MDKHFPADMLAATRGIGIKLVLFTDNPSNDFMDCENCGGLGFFNVFLATEGPFEQPGFPYRKDMKISHWYNDRWWVGKSYNFTCPDCKGERRKKLLQTMMPAISGREPDMASSRR